ncbi:MAG: methyltransferase domain-containing protein [Candidatus Freyarchaeota archaeon]|nr:methyltransferase domain-containing protein [Candidatus Jordarchaeia archaeon]MBS7268399.1 methyltransferase domain-containing protein [Candidatus Jordarchaeia archaeon]MBS7280178.1 methyltransferase domain-containing protein [Candidatus Jordarchaeia archaeon]
MAQKKTAQELWKEIIKPVVPRSHKLYELYFKYTFMGIERGQWLIATLKRFIDFKGKRVLDVGSGSGGISIAFAKNDIEIVNFDADRRYTVVSQRWAEENEVELNQMLASGEEMPFKDESFDVIICSDVIEHLERPKNLVREVTRLLKNGGLVYLTCPNKTSPRLIWEDNHYFLPLVVLLPRKLADVYVRATGRGQKTEVIFLPTYSKLVKMFRKAGITLYSFELENKINEFKKSSLYEKAPGLVNFYSKHVYLKWISPFWIFIGRKEKIPDK